MWSYKWHALVLEDPVYKVLVRWLKNNTSTSANIFQKSSKSHKIQTPPPFQSKLKTKGPLKSIYLQSINKNFFEKFEHDKFQTTVWIFRKINACGNYASANIASLEVYENRQW